MDTLTVITAIALLLIAIGIGHKENGSWAILAGFALAAGAVIARLWSGGGVLQVGIELLRDTGISLLLAATYMGVRKLADSARPFVILGVVSLILSGLLFGARFLWQSIWDRDMQSILVELGPDDSIGEVEGILNRFARTWERAFPTVTLSEDVDLAQVYLVQVSPRHIRSVMDALRADSENVDHVELNIDVHLSLPSSDRMPDQSSRAVMEDDPYVGLQWGLDAVQAHEAHAVLENANPVRKARVAILDTGVESMHEDLQAVYVEGVEDDAHGHGTHCAGLAGAVANNGLGVASLNWEGRFIDVLGFRALSENGQGSIEQIAQAIIDATKAQTDIISMSLGSKSEAQPRVLVNAVEYALDRGVIIAASAGNANEDAIDHFPSNIEGVIAVAAVDQDLTRAEFSNMVGNLSRPLAAPGVDLYSSFLDGQYKPMSGTSMATPVVAGLMGVMRSMNPELTSEEAYTILHETGTEIPDTPLVGRLMNAEAALKSAMGIES
ncbi:MAG: S8 family serine peptidase [Bacteroidota bacterium]|nr:S8 family serine peptidase [Bacteroidota bacterium]MDE2646173.1 S8 family serine peptidase [Bacteroidota bacterium]